VYVLSRKHVYAVHFTASRGHSSNTKAISRRRCKGLLARILHSARVLFSYPADRLNRSAKHAPPPHDVQITVFFLHPLSLIPSLSNAWLGSRAMPTTAPTLIRSPRGGRRVPPSAPIPMLPPPGAKIRHMANAWGWPVWRAAAMEELGEAVPRGLARRGVAWRAGELDGGGHGRARLGPTRPLGELDGEAVGELDVD
jgi:hypothetical protein